MAQTTVGKIRFNPRQQWVSGTSYQVDDVVLYKNKVYVCKQANSSTTLPPLNTAQWDNFGGGTFFAGEWSSATTYAVGDIVTQTRQVAYNSRYNKIERDTYVCIQSGANQNPLTQTSFWKKIAQGTTRDKFKWMGGVREGYVGDFKSVWDNTWASVGPLDSFSEFYTPGMSYNSARIMFVNYRYGLMTLGNNTSFSAGAGYTSSTQRVFAECQFSNNSWFDGSLPTSPSTNAPKIVQVEGNMIRNTLVLFDNGEVHYAGVNSNGEAGCGAISTSFTNFVQCGYSNINRTGSTTVLRNKKVIRIASTSDGTQSACSNYALVRNSNDTRELYAWGYNEFGQLGVGDTTSRSVPTLVSFDQVTNGKIINIWATGGSSGQCFFLTDLGRMYAMGFNGQGNLGVGDQTNRLSPTLVFNWGTSTTDRVKRFNTSGGGNDGTRTSFLVIRGDGRLYTWGNNNRGQLAHGHTFSVCFPLQVYASGYSGVTAVVTNANPQNGSPSGAIINNAWNAWLFGGNFGTLYVARGTSNTSNTVTGAGYNAQRQLARAANNTTDSNILVAVQFNNGTALTNVIDVAAHTGSSTTTCVAARRSDGDWYFGGYAGDRGGAWSNGNADTYNIRVQRDPSNAANNYRIKNNLLFAHQNPRNFRFFWKYIPFGNSGSKYGLYINLYNGSIYVTGAYNENNLFEYNGDIQTNIMTKARGL
jgi:hypothetical protein